MEAFKHALKATKEMLKRRPQSPTAELGGDGGANNSSPGDLKQLVIGLENHSDIQPEKKMAMEHHETSGPEHNTINLDNEVAHFARQREDVTMTDANKPKHTNHETSRTSETGSQADTPTKLREEVALGGSPKDIGRDEVLFDADEELELAQHYVERHRRLCQDWSKKHWDGSLNFMYSDED